MPRSEKARTPLLARTTALLAIGLVLALTVFAASPELHERLHGHEPGSASGGPGEGGVPGGAHGDDGCIVTLFSQGVVLALSLVALAVTRLGLRLADTARFDRIVPGTPRYLHLPPQAPHLGLN